MLIPSNNPDVNKAKADSQNNSDIPNKMIEAPKPAMQNSIVLPWCFCMGIKLINMIFYLTIWQSVIYLPILSIIILIHPIMND